MPKAEWTYHNPVQIHAGPGSLSRLPAFVPGKGNILLVTTPGFVKRGLAGRVVEMLGAERVRVYSDVTPNPELEDLDNATERNVTESIATIVAMGGGSVLDAAKVLSVTLVCGMPRPLHNTLREGTSQNWQANLPVIAIPTTSGTGAEVTPFATVWDSRDHKKYSVTGPAVHPKIALLDPELTLTLPPKETLFTALDAISHALESLWNKNRTIVSEAYAARALSAAVWALPRILEHPDDLDARTTMQQSSLLAGLAISQTRTAIAHSISYPLTSRYNVPHGLACSFSLTNLISLYLEQNPENEFQDLMIAAHKLLAGLELFKMIDSYASQEQILSLQNEMFTPGRADNFDGEITDLNGLISSHRISEKPVPLTRS